MAKKRTKHNPHVKVKSSARDMALDDLFFFTKHVLGYEDLDEDFHRPICNILQHRPDRSDVVLKVARGHFKSTIATIGYPLWRVAHNPDRRFLLAMHTDEVAKQKLKEIMEKVQGQPTLHRLFPEIIPDFGRTQWSATNGATMRRPSQSGEPTFRAVGAGTGVIGTHPDEIVEDDLVAPKKDDMGHEQMEPDTGEIRKGINWHKQSRALIRMPDEGRYTVLGTPWAQHDFLNYLETKEKTLFSFYEMPALVDGEILDGGKLKGTPTFQSRFSLPALEKLLVSMGDFMFSSQYLLKPMTRGDVVFNEERYRYWHELPPREQLEIHMAVDPASSDASYSDYTAIVLVGVDGDGYRYLLDAKRSKTNDYAQIVEWILEHNDRWGGVDHLHVEAVSAAVWLSQILERERYQDGRAPIYSINPVTRGPQEHKNGRIRACARDVHSGGVLFPKDNNLWKPLKAELRYFPRSGDKDTADAFATALAHIWQPLPTPHYAVEETEAIEPWRDGAVILENWQRAHSQGKRAPMGFDRQLAGWTPKAWQEK